MIANYKAIGISYKSCPIEIRELLSLNESQAKQLIGTIKEYTQATDLLVLSTCNRTEIYYASDKDLSATLFNCLGATKGILHLNYYQSYFSLWNNHQDTVQHLFDVSMGLESQVVGDIQLANQVKKSYQWSVDEDVAGPFLHRLMHTIFFTNKKVVQKTAFRDGAASVSYLATELVDELVSNFTQPEILILGLGEIGTDVCRNLKNSQQYNITIANRTHSKAEKLASECGFKTIPYQEVNQAIESADIVLSSVSKSSPTITKDELSSSNINYKAIIDLAIPRSVEPAVESIPGVLLYNLDNLQEKASETLRKRIDAIPEVKSIISEAINEFYEWSKEMTVSPTIQKLKNALEDIRKEELMRFLKNATKKESKLLEEASKSMMQKIMKLPVVQLKDACKRGEAETLVDVLNDLFNLDQQVAENTRRE